MPATTENGGRMPRFASNGTPQVVRGTTRGEVRMSLNGTTGTSVWRDPRFQQLLKAQRLEHGEGAFVIRIESQDLCNIALRGIDIALETSVNRAQQGE